MHVRCLLGTDRFGTEHCGVCFFASFGESGWLRASERFLVDLRKRRKDFLIPKVSIEPSGLNLLVGKWRNWRRRHVARGSGFEFSQSVIVWEFGARKVRRKRTGSVVGHNFKIEECSPQKLGAYVFIHSGFEEWRTGDPERKEPPEVQGRDCDLRHHGARLRRCVSRLRLFA